MIEWLNKLIDTKEPPTPVNIYTPSPVALAIVDAFKKRRKDFIFSFNDGLFSKVSQNAIEAFWYNTKYNSRNVVSVIDTVTGEMFIFSFVDSRPSVSIPFGCGGGFDGLCQKESHFVIMECENIICNRLKPGAKRLGGKATKEAAGMLKSQLAHEKMTAAMYKHLEKVYYK